MKLKSLIGDRIFYKTLLGIAIPIMIQNAVTTFVSLLDNIMVGAVGTETMSGVSIVNQFVFVFNLLAFGVVSAGSIFSAQFFGKGDTEGVRRTLRFKLVTGALSAAAAAAVLILFGDRLISSFLYEGTEGDLSLALREGGEYLSVMLVGLLPYVLSLSYSTTLRETGHTVVPMFASVLAVFTNLVLNYLLIFGKLGLPALGARGAATATVISRFAELAVVMLWTHLHPSVCPWVKGLYSRFVIGGELFRRILAKGLPLIANEFLWALGMTFRNQCFSTRGLEAVAAFNIASTVINLFSVAYMSVGHSITVIVGGLLGAGETEKARTAARRSIAFSVASGAVMGLVMIAFSPLFPLLYNTTGSVRVLAGFMMVISGVTMPFCAFSHSSYFTLRSGGKVFVTLVLDSGFIWAVVFPLAFILSRFTGADIRLLFTLCSFTEFAKVIFGLTLLSKVNWAKKLV